MGKERRAEEKVEEPAEGCESFSTGKSSSKEGFWLVIGSKSVTSTGIYPFFGTAFG
jgi:hypothetical protein